MHTLCVWACSYEHTYVTTFTKFSQSLTPALQNVQALHIQKVHPVPQFIFCYLSGVLEVKGGLDVVGMKEVKHWNVAPDALSESTVSVQSILS